MAVGRAATDARHVARTDAGPGRQAADIRAALSLKDRPRGRPLRDVTTASLPAYELYVKGLTAWHNVRWADSRTLFEEAIRIDQRFQVLHGMSGAGVSN
jgi:hypothetical protein